MRSARLHLYDLKRGVPFEKILSRSNAPICTRTGSRAFRLQLSNIPILRVVATEAGMRQRPSRPFCPTWPRPTDPLNSGGGERSSQWKAGYRLIPAAHVRVKIALVRNHRLQRKHPAFAARWFDGLLRLYPVTGPLLPPSLPSAHCALQTFSASVGARTTRLGRPRSLVENKRDGLVPFPIAIPAKTDQLVRRHERLRAVAAPSRHPVS